MEGKRCFVGKRKGVQSDVQSMESFQPDLMEGKRCFVKFSWRYLLEVGVFGEVFMKVLARRRE
jgi:hypothetical protein